VKLEVEWVKIRDVTGKETKYELDTGMPLLIDKIEIHEDKIVVKRHDVISTVNEVVPFSNLIRYVYPTGKFEG